MAARQSAYWTEHLPALVAWANAAYAMGQTPKWDVWAKEHGATSGNAVRMKYNEHCLRTGAPPERPPLHQPPVPAERGDVLREWLDTLAPVHVSLPKPARRPGQPADCAVIGSDFHFPQHDPAACAAFLDAVRALKPHTVVLNGDTVDMLAVSRFPKDLRHTWSLAEERAAYHAFLAELFDAVAPFGGQVVETEANHSGNGTEGRWMRYLSERLGELASLPDVADRLRYEAVWFPANALDRITLAPSVALAPDLVVLHGDIARKNAGYSARGMLDKWRHSLIHGHTHRLGMTSYRLPGVAGRAEAWVGAWEGGCLCRLDPHYAAAPDWAQGFTVVRHSPDRDWWNVELVKITAGRAVVGGAGGVYGAAA